MCTITPNHHLHLAAAGQPFIPSPSHALSPLLTMPCPVSDMTVPSWPESNMGLYGIHSFVGSQAALPGACEYGDEVFGYVPELKPAYSSSSNYEMGGVEESNIKVAIRYSEEERKERIVRYLKKRNQRNFNKTIKVLTILLLLLLQYIYKLSALIIDFGLLMILVCCFTVCMSEDASRQENTSTRKICSQQQRALSHSDPSPNQPTKQTKRSNGNNIQFFCS